MNTGSFIFFTRILSQSQIISRTSEDFFIEVLSVTTLETTKTSNGISYLHHKGAQLLGLKSRVAVCKPPRRAHTLRSKV